MIPPVQPVATPINPQRPGVLAIVALAVALAAVQELSRGRSTRAWEELTGWRGRTLGHALDAITVGVLVPEVHALADLRRRLARIVRAIDARLDLLLPMTPQWQRDDLAEVVARGRSDKLTAEDRGHLGGEL